MKKFLEVSILCGNLMPNKDKKFVFNFKLFIKNFIFLLLVFFFCSQNAFARLEPTPPSITLIIFNIIILILMFIILQLCCSKFLKGKDFLRILIRCGVIALYFTPIVDGIPAVVFTVYNLVNFLIIVIAAYIPILITWISLFAISWIIRCLIRHRNKASVNYEVRS